MKKQLRQIYVELFQGRLSQKEALERIRTLKLRGRPPLLLATPVWQADGSPASGERVFDYADHHVILCELPVVAGDDALHCLSLQAGPQQNIAQRFSEYALACFERIRTILHAKPQGKVLVQVVVPDHEERVALTGLSALLKTAALENPQLVGQLIVVSPEVSAEDLGRRLAEEKHRTPETLVRYAESGRQVLRWQEVRADAKKPPVAFKDHGVYLITGGLGGLGVLFAKEILGQASEARLVLTGRGALSSDRRARLDELDAHRVSYRQVDVADPDQVEHLVAAIQQDHGRLDGILHCAGMLADNFILKKDRDEFARVLAPKVTGTFNLDQATRHLELDFFVLFSSIAGAMGNVGQADYAAANGFMDQFAAYRNRLVGSGQRHGRTRSINWSLWQAGSMGADPATRELLQQAIGIQPMRTASGVDAFHRSLSWPCDQILVAEGDLARIRGALQGGGPAADTESPTRAAAAIDAGSLVERTEEYLRGQCAEVLKLPFQAVDPQAPMENYGIDSILAMKLTSHLEKTFGSLSKTLFFEYQTIRELTGYFVRSHAARVAALLPPAGVDRPKPAQPEPLRPAEGKRTPGRRVTRRARGGRQETPQEPIAIIGLSGRYPEALDIEAYWQNLRDGRDCITEVPKERWDWREYYSDDRTSSGHHYSKWGGFIAGVDEFDPLFFGISPKEAKLIDPQERLFLQHAWMAIEDAAYTRAGLQVPRDHDLPGQVGVYAGVMYTEYQLFGVEASARGQRLGIMNTAASVANRVSYVLNLHGPSVTLDTMCSSSLTAVHFACLDLKLGRTDLAIAGGVNVSIHPSKYLMLSAGQFISGDGHCQSFGEGGDGYIPGEGVGVVVLKRLSEAERDGDHIYGVIRGSALNHGGKTNGYTVPNPNAQATVISGALVESQVDARHISYVEAHGTGTKLGDPIEIAALGKAFQRDTQDTGFCLIGSAKSNIGHCESAAGIAGLTKVLLQMRHQQIVPSLHSAKLNPHIEFEATPFVVNQTLRPWEPPVIDGRSLPRIAGISSFGAGGSNAHLIVEEYQELPAQSRASGKVLILLSARRAEQLRQKARDLLDFVTRSSGPIDLIAMAYTLQVGREAMEERLAIVVASVEELTEKLRAYVTNEQAIEDAYQGQAKRGGDSLAVVSSDDLRQAAEKWIANESLSELAGIWVKGLEVDWSRLYGDVKPGRVSLPAYPFARERYWIEIPAAARVLARKTETAVLHPLLHSNTSILDEQRYCSTFNGDEPFLTAEKILPAAAYLEMARAAIESAVPERAESAIVELHDVEFGQPIAIAEQTRIDIALVPADGDRIDFEISSKDVILCQGRAAFSREPAPARLDLARQQGGMVRLPAIAQETSGDYVLHPGLIDAALRAAMESISLQPSFPFAVETLRIAWPCSADMRAWVRYAPGGQAADVIKLDIDLCDERGNVAVQLRGVAWKVALQKAAEPVVRAPAPPVRREIAFVPSAPVTVTQAERKMPVISLSAPSQGKKQAISRSAPAERKKPTVSLSAPAERRKQTVSLSVSADRKKQTVSLSAPAERRKSTISRSAPVERKKQAITLSAPSGRRAAITLFNPPASPRLYDDGNGIFSLDIAAIMGAADLRQALDRIRQEPSLEVLILSGLGRGLARGRDAHNAAVEQGLYEAIASFPYPVIAVLKEDTIGAAFMAAALCDLMVCSEEATCGYTDAHGGLYPTTAEAALFGERFGQARAQDFLYVSPASTGRQLREKGWTCPIVAAPQVEASAQKLASALAAKPRNALRLLKQHLTRRLAPLAGALRPVDALPTRDATDRDIAVLALGTADITGLAPALTGNRAVVLTIEDADYGDDVVRELQRVIVESPVPVIAALSGNASGNAWLVSQFCDARVYSRSGAYSSAGISPALAPAAAAVFAQRFGSDAAREILLTGAHYSGLELERRTVALTAEPGRVVSAAVQLAASLAGLPRTMLPEWKQSTAATLQEATAGLPAGWDRDGQTTDLLPAAPAPVSLRSRVITATAHPEGIVVVKMEDRGAKNMFSDAFMEGMREAFAHIEQTPAYKVVILTGYDSYFASGGTREGLLAVQEGRARFTDFNVFQLPLDCKVPVIAAMQGHGIGAGWTLGMFADLVLLSGESRYVSPYMGYGFTPGAGATWVLAGKMGQDLSRESLLTAEPFTGNELKARGVELPVLPRSEVVPAAMVLARQIARTSRGRLIALKWEFTRYHRKTLEETYRLELAMHDETFVGRADTLAQIESKFQHGMDTPPAAPPRPRAEASNPPLGREVLPDVTATLRTFLASELQMREGDVDENAQFIDLGLDSVSGISWIRRINEKYRTSVEPIKVYTYSTLVQLSRHVAEEAAKLGELPEPAVPPQPPVEVSKEPAAREALPDVMPTLRTLLATELQLRESDINENVQFIDLGLDSVSGITWIRKINETWRTTIEPIKVYTYSTLAQLGRHVAEEAAKNGAVLRPVAPEPPPERPAAEIRAATEAPRALTPRRGRKGQRFVASAPALRATEPIAIIGMGGQFPHAKTLEEFWRNIAEGRNCITEVPRHRWNVDDYYHQGALVPGKTNSRWMGALDEYDLFDPLFFNISPTEAEIMDPQQRLFLQACWHSIEDAGYDARTLSGSKCGVFVGCATNDYHQLAGDRAWTAQGFTGNSMSILAARISYFLNLQGPSIAIDTACSSSLVALAHACDSLISGGSDLALAGGVSVLPGPEMHVKAAQSGMLSPDGRCFTFDRRASGIVVGEGVGAVLLKRLSDAERDHDSVRAVICGWGVNQDGKTNGITAPNPESQTRLEQSVYDRHGIDPAGMQLVEAHGTATKLGDPIEVEGLKTAFAKYTQKKDYCALGSVKSNIGHTLTAAGIAGVIKLVLALEHKQLPPTINFERLSEHIDLTGSPFYVNSRLQEWKAGGGERRQAAISAFGFSGTNAHAVIRESLPQTEATRPVFVAALDAKAIVPLSARTAEQLKQKAADLLSFLRKEGHSLNLADVAYTLQVGRSPMDERLGFLVSSVEQLAARLQAFVDGEHAIEDVRHGQVKRDRESLGILAEDEEAKETLLGTWIAQKKLSRLLDLWVKGLELDWNRLYDGVTPRRIQLPVYPFAKERYWVEAQAPAPVVPTTAILHPLVHRNTSDLNGQRYSSTFTGDEPFVAHEGGQKVLPSAVVLDMARAAIGRALPAQPESAAVELRDVVWGEPVVIAGTKEISISLSADDDEIDFEIYSDDAGSERVHCHGQAVLQKTAEASRPLFYQECWQERPLTPAARPSDSASYVIFTDRESGIATGELAGARLVYRAATYRKLSEREYHCRFNEASDIQAVLNDVTSALQPITIGYDWARGEQLAGVHALFGLFRAIRTSAHTVSNVILVGQYDPSRAETCWDYSWAGFERSLRRLLPGTRVSVLYTDTGHCTPRQLLEAVRDGGVLWDHDDRRLALSFQPVELTRASDEPVLLDAGTYLITGGCGALGLMFAKTLAERHRANLLLLGRSPLSPRIEEEVARLKQAGAGEVRYDAVDVSDRSALAAWAQTLPHAIAGIIHAAGVEPAGAFHERTTADVDSVLHPKTLGTLALDEVLGGHPLDFVCYFSSMAASFGDDGACDYSIANRFQTAYAVHRRQNGTGKGKTIVINWPLWAEGGMGFLDAGQTAVYLKMSGQEFGNEPLPTQAGLDIWRDILQSDQTQTMIVIGRPSRVETFLQKLYHGRPQLPEVSETPDRPQTGNRYHYASKTEKVYSLVLPDVHSKMEYLTFCPFESRKPGFSMSATYLNPKAHAEDRRDVHAKQTAMRQVLFAKEDFAKIQSVLDFGCGHGTDVIQIGSLFPHLRVDGFTITADQARLGNQRIASRTLGPRVNVHHKDSSKDPFPGKYDLVFGIEVCPHIEDKESLFRNIRESLREDGTVLLMDMISNQRSSIDGFAGVALLTPEEWLKVISASGFRIDELVDVSPQIANFLYDPEVENNIRNLPQPVRDTYRDYAALSEALGQGFVSYVLVRLKAAGEWDDQQIAVHNQAVLRNPTPYPVALEAMLRRPRVDYPPPTEASWDEPGARTIETPRRPAPDVAVPSAVVSTSGQGRLQEELKTSLAGVLHLKPSGIDTEQPFSELGLDSFLGVEWINSINAKYGTVLPNILVYDYPSIRALASFLGGELAKLPAASVPAAFSIEPAAPAPPVVHERISIAKRRSTRTTKRIDATPAVEKVAIVGMSGRYPQAGSLQEYWQNLTAAKNSIVEIPRHRWDVGRFYDPDPSKPDKTCSKWLGVLDDADCFDPLFFRISPQEALHIDPQQRLFLQEAYRAFEDAGYSGESLSAKKCGVYLGISMNEYASRLLQNGVRVAPLTSNSMAIAAARIAYHLNLRGPAISVDTACSSSLVALHLACQALLCGETDMALAGGVTLWLNPETYLSMSQAGMLSPVGQCQAFDDRADGIVVAEGVGALVLKRLGDAQRDNDFIHGVILGSGVNQDGKTNGITAPSVNSQIELIRDVYARSGIDPETISYIETHGTGTKLGDPIELTALSTVFKEKTAKKNYCGLGSVKSNIGHTGAASGVASVHKVLLAMRHRALVPTLHVRKENSQFSFADSPFYISRETKPWRVDEGSLRRASVSAFGFSGTNAHVVIEEYPHEQVATYRGDVNFIVPLAARTEEQLRQRARDLLECIGTKQMDLAGLAYTLQTGRDAMEERLGFVVSSLEQLRAMLTAYVDGGKTTEDVYRGRVEPGDGDLAVVGRDDDMQEAVERWIARRKLSRLTELWTRGLKFDWNKLWHDPKPRRVSLPTYPFAREHYWIDDAPLTPSTTLSFDRELELAGDIRSIEDVINQVGDELIETREAVRLLKVLV
jgi:acyl transferase domain-containing protein/enoyl-CoA hydratase/carnithine racemase/acyl carrier protein/SAM-dependent methyltransferase